MCAVQIDKLAELVSENPAGTTLLLTDDEIMFNGDDPRGKSLVALQILYSRLPVAAKPLVIVSDKTRDISITMGGIPVEDVSIGAIQEIIDATALIDECMTASECENEAEMYSVCHDGANRKTVMSPWARSPTEAAMKFLLATAPEFTDQPEYLMALDPVGEKSFTLRLQCDWTEFDLDEHLARAKDAISLHFEGREDTPFTPY
jgi:hypothetical protein